MKQFYSPHFITSSKYVKNHFIHCCIRSTNVPFFPVHFSYYVLHGFPSFDLKLNVLTFATFNTVILWVFLNFTVFLKMFQQFSYKNRWCLKSNGKSLSILTLKGSGRLDFSSKFYFQGKAEVLRTTFLTAINLLSLTNYRLD